MIEYKMSPEIANDELNALFRESWPNHLDRDFSKVLARSLVFICAFSGNKLVGFVNVAWDGGVHSFMLDTTVHPDFRRQGIGTELVKRAIDSSRGRGLEWLHVDYAELTATPDKKLPAPWARQWLRR